MTTDQLIRAAAKRSGLYICDTKAALQALLDTIVETVADGEAVRIEGFGVFSAREAAAKIGRNVYTGEQMTIPARRVPTFKAWSRFREEVKDEE